VGGTSGVVGVASEEDGNIGGVEVRSEEVDEEEGDELSKLSKCKKIGDGKVKM